MVKLTTKDGKKVAITSEFVPAIEMISGGTRVYVDTDSINIDSYIDVTEDFDEVQAMMEEDY